MEQHDDDERPVFSEAPGEDEDGGEAQATEDPELAVVHATRDLDDVADAVFEERLDDLEFETANSVAINVACRLLGRALGRLVTVSNKPEEVAELVRRGLELGVGRALPMEVLVTIEGRAHQAWLRKVTDRFIETMVRATKIAIAMNPEGTRNGD